MASKDAMEEHWRTTCSLVSKPPIGKVYSCGCCKIMVKSADKMKAHWKQKCTYFCRKDLQDVLVKNKNTSEFLLKSLQPVQIFNEAAHLERDPNSDAAPKQLKNSSNVISKEKKLEAAKNKKQKRKKNSHRSQDSKRAKSFKPHNLEVVPNPPPGNLTPEVASIDETGTIKAGEIGEKLFEHTIDPNALEAIYQELSQQFVTIDGESLRKLCI